MSKDAKTPDTRAYKTKAEAIAAASALLAEKKYDAAAKALADAPAEDEAPAKEEPAAEPEKKSQAAELSPEAQALARDAAELAQLRSERDARDTAERKTLALALVELGAETPATVAEEHVTASPLPKLRARVDALRAQPKRAASALPAVVTPPASGAGTGVDALNDVERWHYDQIKDDDAKSRYLALRLAGKAKQETK